MGQTFGYNERSQITGIRLNAPEGIDCVMVANMLQSIKCLPTGNANRENFAHTSVYSFDLLIFVFVLSSLLL